MKTITQDELLIEFTAWAERRGRCANGAVLSAFLDASAREAAHDPTSWQPGEAHNAVINAVCDDPGILIGRTALLRGTLDSFFRFLRNTGRLRGNSIDTASLRKEASRAVRTLEQALETVQTLRTSAPELLDELELVEEEDWLHPDDPRYRVRELLRDLGLAGSPGVPLPAVDQAAAEALGSVYLEQLFRVADQTTGWIVKPDQLLPCGGDTRRVAATLGVDEEDFVDLWLAASIAGVIRVRDGSVVPGTTRAELAVLSPLRQLVIVSRTTRSRLDRLLLDETGAAVVALLVWSLIEDGAWSRSRRLLPGVAARTTGTTASRRGTRQWRIWTVVFRPWWTPACSSEMATGLG